MKPTAYTVPEVPGSSRKSHRPYTHAVIGRPDSRCSAIHYAADLAKNEGQKRRWDAKNWDDWKRASEATVGQLYRNHNGFMVEAPDYAVRIGAEFIAKNPDRQAYIDGQAAERQAALEKMRAGTAGELQVLQWSMSHKNAMKSVVTHQHHHSDVRVVACIVA